jgi:hypothetical protein
MAYQNGNKPIVTNGLVYALDFGNTKSYNSGSNRAVSLAYDPTVTIVTGSTAIPALVSGILNFTGSQFVQRSGSLEALDPTGSFTISLTVRAATTGSLFSQNLTGKNLGSRITTASSDFGFNLTQGTYSRTIPRTATTATLQHITYRYNSGTIDTFVNGLPVTSSVANPTILTSVVTSSLFINSGSNSFSGSLANFYVYNRALTADEIWSNYQLSVTRYGFTTASNKPYSIDENLYQWIQSTGTTDTNTISSISTFISGLKSTGLWNKLQVIYPFVGTTTGSQTINLKEPGLYRLGLTGSFSASNAGLYPSSSTSYINSIPGTTVHPLVNSASAHLSLLSYDLPTGNGFLGGNSLPALGGDVIISSGSKILHAFKTVGTSSFTMLNPAVTNVEVMVVAGGGGSPGAYAGGGGGAGGLIYSSSFAITPGSNLQVIVGDGGTGYANGQNSVFSTISATGGGAGGEYNGVNATNGGSGGGGRGVPGVVTVSPSGSGIPGQGFDGGAGSGDRQAGGGGGGAGGTGSNSGNFSPGRGGSGSFYSQFSTVGGSPAGWFAGGGGGGADPGGNGAGGIGGGGTGVSGVINTGGGAGGNSGAPGDRKGGSGIIIVSYNIPASALTGSGTGLYLTDTAVTGSVNSQFTSGITGSGNIGLLTVSRTGSGTFSLHKNNVSQSFASASLGALSTDIFFNTANLAGSSSLPLQANLAYASIGAGLTTSEVATYHNLVSQLQTNLKRQNTLLDNYSGSAAAYSLRRIGPSSYFGPAIRVRRDSDNTLRDIGFTSDGQLDTVGLLDFVGVTGSGFVNTWYDQSGNSRDAIQNTNGSQPLVITSGSIISENIKPALQFDGSNDGFGLSIPSPSTLGGGSEYSVVSRVSSSHPIVTFNDGAASNLYSLWIFPGLGWLSRFGTSLQNFGNLSHINQMLISTNRKSSTTEMYRNNMLLGDINNTTLTTSNFGSFGNGPQATNGKIQESILYPSNQSLNRTALESNINSNYKIYGSATASFDPDYSAFITATGITQPTQSAALETLVSDLKSYGLWSKMKAIYPMVTDKYNLYSNTENLSTGWLTTNSSVTASNVAGPFTASLVANRLNDSISSPVTLTVTPDGISAYIIDGSTNPTLSLEKGRTYNFNISATNHPFYIMTGSGARTVDGQYNTGVTGQGTENGTLTFTVPNNAPSALAYICGNHTPMAGTISIIENTDQHYIYQTVTLTSGSAYVMSTYARWNGRDYIVLNPDGNSKTWFDIRNGFVSSSLGTVATASITRVSGSASNPSGSWYRCAMVFTSSVSTPYNTSIQLAETNGSLTYGSLTGLSGSFLWGAQFEPGSFISPYLSNTTNNAYTTSSVLDQFKFNLKNPADTDAAFRITYSGSWNGGYSGAKGDGATGYADTKFNPNSEASVGANDMHISAYTNTNQTGIEASIIGGYDSNRETTIAPKWVDNYFYADINDNVFTSISTPNALSQGYYIGNKNNTGNNLGYKNGIKVINGANVSNGKTNVNLYLGARRTAGGVDRYNTYTIQIITIGNGLTDYEAKALYWIVQKYQTTLGRQVY